MTPSVRQQLVNAVKTRFAAIRIANGYATEIGAWQYEWKTTPFAAEEMPGHAIEDLADEIKQGMVQRHEHKLTLRAVAAIAAGPDTSAQLREAVADFHKAIGVDTRWGGLALATWPKSAMMSVIQNETVQGHAVIEFVIEYRTPQWNDRVAITQGTP
jgi:hypothetical protein